MKKIVFSFILSLFSIIAFSQVVINVGSKSQIPAYPYFMVKGNLYLPKVLTPPTLRPSLLGIGVDTIGASVLSLSDYTLYGYTGGDTWVPLTNAFPIPSGTDRNQVLRWNELTNSWGGQRLFDVMQQDSTDDYYNLTVDLVKRVDILGSSTNPPWIKGIDSSMVWGLQAGLNNKVSQIDNWLFNVRVRGASSDSSIEANDSTINEIIADGIYHLYIPDSVEYDYEELDQQEKLIIFDGHLGALAWADNSFQHTNTGAAGYLTFRPIHTQTNNSSILKMMPYGLNTKANIPAELDQYQEDYDSRSQANYTQSMLRTVSAGSTSTSTYGRGAFGMLSFAAGYPSAVLPELQVGFSLSNGVDGIRVVRGFLDLPDSISFARPWYPENTVVTLDSGKYTFVNSSGIRVYKILSTGTYDATTPPSHTSGTSLNGTVSLQYYTTLSTANDFTQTVIGSVNDGFINDSLVKLWVTGGIRVDGDINLKNGSKFQFLNSSNVIDEHWIQRNANNIIFSYGDGNPTFTLNNAGYIKETNSAHLFATLAKADGATTISAATTYFVSCNDASPTTVTDITGGIFNGQVIVINFNNGQTTLQNNATIGISGGANYTSVSGSSIAFRYTGSVWKEIYRSNPPGMYTTAYRLLGNATASTATVGEVNFKEVGSTAYVGNVAWTGGAAPSGTENHTYSWSQTGAWVTLNIWLVYGTAGTTDTKVVMDLPAGAPTPDEPSGLGTANDVMWIGSGGMTATPGGAIVNGNSAHISVNSGDTGYVMIVNSNSVSARVVHSQVTYRTSTNP